MAWGLRLTFLLEGDELLLFIFELDLRGVDGGSGFILVGGESWKRVGRSDSAVITQPSRATIAPGKSTLL